MTRAEKCKTCRIRLLTTKPTNWNIYIYLVFLKLYHNANNITLTSRKLSFPSPSSSASLIRRTIAELFSNYANIIRTKIINKQKRICHINTIDQNLPEIHEHNHDYGKLSRYCNLIIGKRWLRRLVPTELINYALLLKNILIILITVLRTKRTNFDRYIYVFIILCIILNRYDRIATKSSYLKYEKKN
ncbi:hypothetical protein AGLY_014400 [Aphis glycines]|uniref:Uncharacterized protein n=1 Tax=Aphis glycines TaxID=307491 RepID=A0A6G0T4E9_APHGL|nr:hypothetical protein AGLY_014400 [Aphis glycines]